MKSTTPRSSPVPSGMGSMREFQTDDRHRGDHTHGIGTNTLSIVAWIVTTDASRT
jgi:hypothetical protein